MNISQNQPDPNTTASQLQASGLAAKAENLAKTPKPDATREAFQDFLGQTFFAEMIKSLRSSQEPSSYFHGGRAEEVFQSQLDQVLSEELSDASADQFSDPMFELFMLQSQR